MTGEATTSKPKKEDTAPSGKKEAITSEKPKQEKPATPEKTKEVVELEGQVENLTTKLNQSQVLQGQADKKARIERIERLKVEKRLEAIRSGDTAIPPEEPTGETAVEKEVRLEARIGIQNLLLGSDEYRELLEKDITLREVMKNNPFALIGEYFDSQDAIEQIKEILDKRVSSLKESQPKEKPKEGKEFEAGAVQPSESASPEIKTSSEKALAVGDIAGSIKSKIRVQTE